MTTTFYSVDKTQDEFGADRFFVGRGGSWVDGPFDTVEQANQQAGHLNRKIEGAKVAGLLNPLPVGTEFRLHGGSTAAFESRAGGYLVGAFGVSRAYVALYRKNDQGTWDQVEAPDMPLVVNMDAAHLGYCVGFDAVKAALA